MNETIGVKGGHNDRRRTIKIKESKKKKIKETEKDKELLELEQKVKKQQTITLIKTLPIALAGGTFKVLYDTATGKDPIDKEEYNSKWKVKEYDSDHTTLQHGEKPNEREVVVTPTGQKVVVYVDKDNKKNILEDILILPEPENVKGEGFEPVDDNKIELLDENSDNKKKKPVSETVNSSNENKKTDNFKKNSIDEIFVSGGYSLTDNMDFDSLSDVSKETLGKLKAKKILDVYEKQLKDVRYELRQLIFDYNALVKANDEAVLSSDAQIILDRLSDIISKIESLRDKIKIEDFDKYDDNYIYTLIEGYLAEFKDHKLVSELKDSPLYILISKKLDELDSKKTNLNKKVDEKKDELALKEEKFDELKEKYSKLDRFNKELVDFQREQEVLLKELREKVRTAESVEEKIRYEVQAMSAQSRRTLRLLTLQMMFPGPRIARGLAATTASYLYFVNNIIRPKTVARRYRTVKVIDYSKEIKSNISLLDDAINTLGKTSTQIDKMITMIKEEYSDYFGVIPECDELLHNLRKIKNDLEEKEYEMEKVKEEQRLLLEKNNAKVLKRGEFRM